MTGISGLTEPGHVGLDSRAEELLAIRRRWPAGPGVHAHHVVTEIVNAAETVMVSST